MITLRYHFTGQEISFLNDLFFTFESKFVRLVLDFLSNPDCPRKWNPSECWHYTGETSFLVSILLDTCNVLAYRMLAAWV